MFEEFLEPSAAADPVKDRQAKDVAHLLADLPPLMGLDQYAQVLGVSRSSVYRAAAADRLGVPLLHVGGRMRVRSVDVRRLMFGDLPAA